ncbi:MAG TPA: tetratricopeptide repeat protein, partial [Pirellulales bacterium]|nr:tetratricopeptide repeat protein [Pirellulales bacterium]
AELQSERERLAQAAQARSPKPSAGDPAAGESTGAGADSPLPPPAAASEEAAKPAADDSAKGSESPTANAGPAEGPNPPTKSEQPAAAGRPAMPPPAPLPAAGISPPPSAAAQQSADLQRQRLQLLRQIYEQRHDLLEEFADLEAKGESVSKSITNAEGELIAINGLGAILTAKMAAEQLRPDRNLSLIATWAGEYAALDAQASAVKLGLEQLQTQYASVAEQLKEADAEAVQLRSAWLAVVDPFGQLDSGDKDSAIAAFTEWVTLEPKAPWAWLARGFAYWQLGRLDEALSDFNAAVNLQGPMVSNSLAARGGLLHAMHKSKEAMTDFGKALKANKTDGMVYLFRGRAAAADEKYQSAQRDFKTAINLDAKDAEARRNMALLLAACPKDRYRNGKKAVEYAQEACELTQWKSSSALDTLAAACAEAGQFDQACDWAEKAVALARGANRGQCLARLKQYQAHQPLRLDWRNQSGNPSAAAEAPVSR